MVLCLLIGSIIAVAMVSSIPMYTGGVLQRTLTRDLGDFEQSRSINPGRLNIKMDMKYAVAEGNRLRDLQCTGKKNK